MEIVIPQGKLRWNGTGEAWQGGKGRGRPSSNPYKTDGEQRESMENLNKASF